MIRVNDRDSLKESLQSNNIYTNINYPTALPFLPAYSYLNHSENEFRMLFLTNQRFKPPNVPEIMLDEQEYVSMKIREFLSDRR